MADLLSSFSSDVIGESTDSENQNSDVHNCWPDAGERRADRSRSQLITNRQDYLD